MSCSEEERDKSTLDFEGESIRVRIAVGSCPLVFLYSWFVSYLSFASLLFKHVKNVSYVKNSRIIIEIVDINEQRRWEK